MNIRCTTILILLFSFNQNFAQKSSQNFQEKNRQKIVLLNDWQYYLDQGKKEFHTNPPQQVTWETVSIPHSLKLTSTTKDDSTDDEYQLTFHRWVGWYKRKIKVDAPVGQKVFLEFEGAHQVTKLWVNGDYVGEHSVGGYTPFHFDITEFVKMDGAENEIILSVDNRRNSNIPPEGDRYDYIKWGGLYRDVYLVVTNPLHITFPWEQKQAGVFVTTPTVTAEDATIQVKTNIKNETAATKRCKVVTRIIDQTGKVVLMMRSERQLPAGSDHTFSQVGGITEEVNLWSPETPYLYRVHTTILDGDQVVDNLESPLGIRSIAILSNRGFVLNGKDVELIGVNRHQAHLFIGDAVPNSLHWKDAWQFKQAGFNSVRLAHYPHDNAFLEACDELGLMVFEEPPTWIGIGNSIWMDRLEEATRRMVRNHRNHPSVIMWGAAINHRGPVERLHYACKEEDPTRPTASNGAPWTGPRHSGVTDIYAPMDYQNMPILANELTYLCEHGNSDDASRNQFEVSKSKQMANLIGVAAWTAHDYQTFKNTALYGTRRIWSAYRVPNPPYYWYQSELTQKPMIYLADERVSKDGKLVIFSNCQRIDLYHNETLVESKFPNNTPNLLYLDHPGFTFDYAWTSGTLTAKGFLNNQLVVSHTRHFPGAPVQLKVEIETDNRSFFANGSDLKMVQCYLLDKNGERVVSATDEVTFKVSGAGKLIEHPDIDANPKSPLYGVATAYLQSTTQPGKITVTATAKGLPAASDEITTTHFEYDQILARARPIYNLKKEQIDLSSSLKQINSGAVAAFEFGEHIATSVTSEFLQFGWTGWVGEDAVKETFSSKIFDACKYTLSADQEMSWFAGWGLSGNLPYLALDGLQLPAAGTLTLKIDALPKGIYHLKTYHHYNKKLKPSSATLQIKVTDARGKQRLARESVALSAGDLFSKNPAHAAFTIYADGNHPILINFGSQKDIPIVLNGFELEEKSRSMEK